MTDRAMLDIGLELDTLSSSVPTLSNLTLHNDRR